MAEEKPQQQGPQPPVSDPKQQAAPRETQKGGYQGDNKGSVKYTTKTLTPDKEG